MTDWQPIGTAPKDGRQIILATTTPQRFGLVRAGEWWVKHGMWSTDWEPTHWMPLPEAPKI